EFRRVLFRSYVGHLRAEVAPSLVDGDDGFHQLIAFSILHDIAAGTVTQGVDDVLPFLVHGQEDEANFRKFRNELFEGFQARYSRHLYVSEYHIRLKSFVFIDKRLTVFDLSDDRKAFIAIQE